jgi:septum formation protein
MPGKINIILASKSENRKHLLESLGISFSVTASEIDEDSIQGKTPEERVRAIACAKARKVASFKQGLIIAADTISVYNGQQYQKPKSREEAKTMLRKLSGQTGHVFTGVCIINTGEKREISDVNEIILKCKILSENEIADYVANNPVTEWAAAYNPLYPASASIFRPVNPMKYKIEYYGIGIDTLAEELQRIGIMVDLSVCRQ